MTSASEVEVVARPKALILSGVTGVGKSALAVRLARELNGEIISADSVSVYRHLDIGSDKPCAMWRRQIPHHLIDVADPETSLEKPFTAAAFAVEARRLIRDISSRGRVPIVSGGTAFYLNCLLRGFSKVPSTDATTLDIIKQAFDAQPAWEEALDTIANGLGGDDAVRSLKIRDYLSHVERSNRRRLERAVQRVRALKDDEEIPEYDARRNFQEQQQDSDDDNDNDNDSIEFRCVFLTYKREALYRKLDWRCEKLLQRGLLDEVQHLLHRKMLPPGSGPALAVGYRQAIDYLTSKEERWANDPGEGARDAFNLDRFWVFLDQFQAAMRNLARKQMTWYRRDSMFRFMEVNEADDAEHTLVELKKFLGLSPEELSDFVNSPNYSLEQKSLRSVISEEDMKKQRQYRTTLKIFRREFNVDTILHLMAQRVPVPENAGTHPIQLKS